MKKKCIFWPRAWVNLFGKMRFWRLWKSFFSSPKKVSFSPPLEKYDFWDFEKFWLYSQKEFIFSSRTSWNLISSLMLTENKKWKKKKTAFFDQEHGLTSLEKWDFGDFEKVFLVVQKKFLFLYKVIKHYFYSSFDQI